MKRIAIFVDVQNIYYTAQETYGRQFNYRKLWQRIAAEGEIVSAIDALQAAMDVDTVVLLSGDGDFDLLVERIKKDYAITVEVYGVPGLTANSLINSASVYHPIEEDLLM